MSPAMIEQMLEALMPTLKSRNKAKQQLEQFWADKMALVWTTMDVHRAANERETALTEEEARKVLSQLHGFHNKQYGLQWRDVIELILDMGIGRKLTKPEVYRFVRADVIAIQKPTRSRKHK